MAYISFQPSDFFNTVLYTGNQPSSNPVTGVGFQPDIIWVKDRDATPNHVFFDAVRGTTKSFYPNLTNAEVTDANGLTAFGADGFTVADWSQPNTNGDDYVSWNWKMGTTSGATFGTAGITPTSYSINTTTGQGVYKYSGGDGFGASTVAHGLGAAPDWVIIKRIEDNGHGWQTTNTKLGFTHTLKIESNGAVSTSTPWWNDTAPTSDVVNIGGDSWNNLSGKTFMMYCFTNKRGFFKTGSYTGNGNADGAFVYTGFRPAFVLVKKTNGTGSWWLFDNKRLGYNVANDRLYTDDTAVEATATVIDFVSNGFKFRTTDGDLNGDGNTIIYASFAEFPFVSSNSKAGTAR